MAGCCRMGRRVVFNRQSLPDLAAVMVRGGAEGGAGMSEIADDMREGFCCSLCGVYFERENGYPVVCRACWKAVGKRATGTPPITEEGWQLTLQAELS